MNKPYYDLASALYMAKEHSMRFDFPDDYMHHLRNLDLVDFLSTRQHISHLFDLQYYPSDPSILEPQDSDESKEGFVFDDGGWIDGEHFFDQLEDPKLTAFRNGKPFLQPKYEVKND